MIMQKFKWVLLLILLLLPLLAINARLNAKGSNARHQPSDEVKIEYVGHIGGTIKAVFVQGNYAYIGQGPRLTILDVSNPAEPTVVGKTEPFPNIVEDIYVSGNYAYVASGSGLRVVDISTPTSPQEVALFDTPGLVKDVALSGNYAYAASGIDGLRVIDIRVPTSPQEVGSIDTPGSASNVALSGNYAYVAASSSGLRVIDISTPTSPQEVGSVDTPGYADGVALSDSYAYVADGNGGLRVVDISTPTSPQEVGSVDIPGSANGVVLSGNYAYVTNTSNGLRVIDISTPTTPQEVASLSDSAYGYDVALSGNHAYVASGSELRVIDISTPINPTQVGSLDTLIDAYDVVLSDNYAYLVDSDGLRVIDISTPTNPISVGLYEMPGYAEDVALSGNYVYMAGYHSDYDGGLRVIDISTPTSPQEVGFVETPDYAEGVAVSGNYAYVANDYEGLRVIEISEPTNPQEVGFYRTPGFAVGVAVGGDYAYVADDYEGLRVIDISEPTNPQEVGFYNNFSSFIKLTVIGNYVYVIDEYDGLRVIDISTPTSPQEVGFVETPDYAQDVAVSGNVALVADYDEGLRVIDISIPFIPQEVASYDTPGSAYGVALNGNLAYVADGSGGLLVLRLIGIEPTPTPTPTQTVTPIPTSESNPDAYEADDECEQAQAIPIDGSIQLHTFHDYADQDWVSFEAVEQTKYVVQARTPADSSADVSVELYSDCGQITQPPDNPSFSPDIRLTFDAPATGTYHLRFLNQEPNLYGEHVSYEVSVRQLNENVNPGALVLVAGRLYRDDKKDLQANIQNVTNAAYRLFRAKSYPADRIFYMATDTQIDANGDGQPDVNALSSQANLEYAITEWTADKGLGPERAFTLYLMDHGGLNGIFYLDGPLSETVTAQQLDQWLDELEANAPGVKINIIIEACYSGSFLNGLRGQSDQNLAGILGGPNRIIAASTEAYALAYASSEGAWFSDALIDALTQDMSLAEAFIEGRNAALQFHPDQTAWIDGNGNGWPNEEEDFQAAAQRSFADAGSFADDKWPPYIKQAAVRNINDIQGQIWAEVRDDNGVTGVWAVIYPPSYQPPTASEQLVSGPSPISLTPQEGNEGNEYLISYPEFTESGEYRIVFYAQDNEELQARPKEVTVQIKTSSSNSYQLYLPAITR